jgi:anti-sigma regulatory factor (Ser/Thr protein kinase)
VAAPAVVELEVASAPESVALVRAALKGFAAGLRLDPELLDDLQMAISEACNNVVLHAYPEPPGRLGVSMSADRSGIDAVVRDEGQGFDTDLTEESTGLGLPLIRSLADESEVRQPQGGGTEVAMRFDRDLASLAPDGPARAETAPPGEALTPGAVVRAAVTPVTLLPDVLGRLVRLLAGQARFSVERFAEIHIVVDALVRLAERFAPHGIVRFGLVAETRRLQLQIGPFRRRPGAIAGARAHKEVAALIGRLVDELAVEPLNGDDFVRLTVTEHGLAHAAAASGRG